MNINENLKNEIKSQETIHKHISAPKHLHTTIVASFHIISDTIL